MDKPNDWVCLDCKNGFMEEDIYNSGLTCPTCGGTLVDSVQAANDSEEL